MRTRVNSNPTISKILGADFVKRIRGVSGIKPVYFGQISNETYFKLLTCHDSLARVFNRLVASVGSGSVSWDLQTLAGRLLGSRLVLEQLEDDRFIRKGI